MAMKETQLHKDAFEHYYSLDYERSYAKVAMKFGRSAKTVEKWGAEFKWQDRVDQRESDRRKKAAEQSAVENEVDWITRNLRIVKRFIYEHAKNVDKMKLSPKTLVDLITLESKLRTGYDQAISVRHQHEITNMDRITLKQEIAKQIASLKKIERVRQFIPEEDLNTIEADYTVTGGKNEREGKDANGNGE